MLSDITPTFNTEIKFYPLGISVEDMNGEKINIEETNIHCLNDGCKFDTLPVYLPVAYNDGVFTKMGNKNSMVFCSFNCACSYNMKLNDNYTDERNRLLKYYYYNINKKNIKNIYH